MSIQQKDIKAAIDLLDQSECDAGDAERIVSVLMQCGNEIAKLRSECDILYSKLDKMEGRATLAEVQRDEWIKASGLVVTEAESLKKQRDELVAALESVKTPVQFWQSRNGGFRTAYASLLTIIDSALAKVKK